MLLLLLLLFSGGFGGECFFIVGCDTDDEDGTECILYVYGYVCVRASRLGADAEVPLTSSCFLLFGV
jgi:hypothetical protein